MTTNPSAVENEFRSGLAVLFLILLLCLISMFSGFQKSEAPIDVLWQFSPLGLLLNFDPLSLQYPSETSFAGTLGATLDYLQVFLVTCLLEAPFYFLIFRRERWLRILMILLVSNALTHPIVFFVFPALFSRYVPMLLTAEVFAPAVEILAVLYFARRNPQINRLAAAGMIVVGNLFSWQMGVVAWNLF